jgi:hypothetical protein
VDSLVQALKKFDPKRFNSDAIRRSAEKFSPQEFQKSVKKFVQLALQKAD